MEKIKKKLTKSVPLWLLIMVLLLVPLSYVLAYPIKTYVFHQEVVEINRQDTAFTILLYNELPLKNRYIVTLRLQNSIGETVHGNATMILYAMDGLTQLANMTKQTGDLASGDTITLFFNFAYGRGAVNGTDLILWDNRTSIS